MRDSISAALLSGPVAQPDGALLFEFKFAASAEVFSGHFPGYPLLPGIFQIEMARMASEKALGCRLTLNEIVKAKFLRPVLPEETIRLSLKLAEEKSIISVRAGLAAGGQPAGETRLRLCRNE